MEKSWEELRGEEPLNERRVAVYRQLMEAQELVGAMRAVELGQAAIDAALAESVSTTAEDEADEELYVGALTRYVEALGGRAVALGNPLVGIRAEFPGWSVAVPRFRR